MHVGKVENPPDATVAKDNEKKMSWATQRHFVGTRLDVANAYLASLDRIVKMFFCERD